MKSFETNLKNTGFSIKKNTGQIQFLFDEELKTDFLETNKTSVFAI